MSDNGHQPAQDPGTPDGAGRPPGDGGYGSMPNLSGDPMRQAPQVEQPPSIALAVKLMYAGAVVSLIGLITSLFMQDQMRAAAKDALSKQGKATDAASLDSAVQAGLILGIVISLVGVGLWILMARTNAAGRSWARIVATVLGVLNILFTVVGLSGSTSTAASTIINVVSALLAVAILVLLWRKDSTAFYQAHATPRA